MTTTQHGRRIPGVLPLVAWFALAYNIAVILWGAVVRITGSGAGCGEHWPLCDGQVVPLSFDTAKIIEMSHRMTSGLSGMLAIVVLALAFRSSPKGHPVRFGAFLSLFFIVLEGLVGGAQVLLGLTAHSTDPARGIVQGIHLANTFLLTGGVYFTALWASGEPRVRLRELKGQGRAALHITAGAALLLLLAGMTGAVTALGDLLFAPAAGTPIDTIRNDFGLTAHFFERLRIFHPIVAVITAAYLSWLAWWLGQKAPSPRVQRTANVLWGLVVLQMFVGVLNIYLRAPDHMQLLHLLLACGLWLCTVHLGHVALFQLTPSSSNEAQP